MGTHPAKSKGRKRSAELRKGKSIWGWWLGKKNPESEQVWFLLTDVKQTWPRLWDRFALQWYPQGWRKQIWFSLIDVKQAWSIMVHGHKGILPGPPHQFSFDDAEKKESDWRIGEKLDHWQRNGFSLVCIHGNRVGTEIKTIHAQWVKWLWSWRIEYWITCLSICLFTRTAYSFASTAHSLACSALLALLAHSAALLRLLTRLLTHSQAHGRENHKMLEHQAVLSHSAFPSLSSSSSSSPSSSLIIVQFPPFNIH